MEQQESGYPVLGPRAPGTNSLIQMKEEKGGCTHDMNLGLNDYTLSHYLLGHQ